MNDWTIDYIKHVLETRDWSANKLATMAGLASSTIARPLREGGRLDYRLSRLTIQKIAKASGVDPGPFIPAGLFEEAASYTPATRAGRILAELDGDAARAAAQPTNEIKIAIVGSLAQIVATVDRAGLARLRAKLDAIESMLDD
jgi:transcriptional regulator with XRE-family HTH domain